MNYDLQHSDLSTVLAEGRFVADETKRMFGQLSAEQINWKPSGDEWSVGQCFDHLIISNRLLLTVIEEIRQGKRGPRAWERVPLLPRFFGKLLIRTLRADIGRNVKAPRALEPSASRIPAGIITSFVEQHDRLLHLMAETRVLELERITITSPVARLITYSLMDAYRLIVVHEQNHFLQASRLVQLPGFPLSAVAKQRQ
jgi:DinB superfamily